jgi:hypothetical protein
MCTLVGEVANEMKIVQLLGDISTPFNLDICESFEAACKKLNSVVAPLLATAGEQLTQLTKDVCTTLADNAQVSLIIPIRSDL